MADYLKDLIKKAKEEKKKGKKKKFDVDFDSKSKKKMKDIEDKFSIPEMPKAPKTPLTSKVEVEPVLSEKQRKEAEALEQKRKQEVPEKSEIEREIEKKQKEEIASYGKVKIYKVKEQPLLLYVVPVPRPTAGEKSVINTIKEAATRLISIAPYRIRDLEQRRTVYYQRVMDILHASPELKIPENRFPFYADAVVREMVGYGLIDQLVQDDKLEEIMVIGPKKPVYVFHRDYEMMLTNIEFFSDQEVEDLINKIAREVGRRVDISAPLLDARLPDGSRVNATIAPASVSGATLTIRKFRTDPYSLIDLVNFGTINSEAAAFLWLMVEGLGVRPANILIAGGTGSGKTTTLNVLSAMIPEHERIVSIEDTAELNLPLKHWIRLEARPPGLEGKGELTMDVLTKNSLRMRPDRIIVGEVRHAEAFTLFTALNTGHDGSMGTVHSNSAQETVVRITSPPMNVPMLMLSGLDFILIEHRLHDRRKGTIRRITEISEVSGVLEGKPSTESLYERDPVKDTLVRTSVPSRYVDTLGKLTGLKKAQIEAILKGRQKFLKTIMDKNIRSVPDVSFSLQQYLSEKD